ncbi:uncharacterized protein [Eleutherodactylus coqui]|uniref:uncharacterized protein n=1 Tax=Eleutherodactylus coqui TaxID=57060 RepID=UPI0034628F6C
MAPIVVKKVQMIALIRERPLLWNPRIVQYYHRRRRNEAWEEVAEQLFDNQWLTARSAGRARMLNELRRKWRSCRDQMRREQIRLQSRGAGVSRRRGFYLAPHLKFLRPVLRLRQPMNNIHATAQATSSLKGKSSPPAASTGNKPTKSVAAAPAPAGLTPPAPGPSQAQHIRRAARRRHRQREEPLAGRIVDLLVLSFLRGQRQIDWAEGFGQLVAATCRRIPAEVQLELQCAVTALMSMAQHPPAVTQVFNAIQSSYGDWLRQQHAALQPQQDLQIGNDEVANQPHMYEGSQRGLCPKG